MRCFCSHRQSRMYRQSYNRGGNNDYQDDHHDYNDDDMNDDHEDDHDHMKAISQPKVDYWAGYYDFLINEGSYKFWAVFQVMIQKKPLQRLISPADFESEHDISFPLARNCSFADLQRFCGVVLCQSKSTNNGRLFRRYISPAKTPLASARRT